MERSQKSSFRVSREFGSRSTRMVLKLACPVSVLLVHIARLAREPCNAPRSAVPARGCDCFRVLAPVVVQFLWRIAPTTVWPSCVAVSLSSSTAFVLLGSGQLRLCLSLFERKFDGQSSPEFVCSVLSHCFCFGVGFRQILSRLKLLSIAKFAEWK